MHECKVLRALKLIDLLRIVNDSFLVVLYLLHHGWPHLEQFIHVSLIRTLLQLDVLTMLHGHCKIAIQGLLFYDTSFFFLSYLLPKRCHVLTQLFLVRILLS